MPLGHVSPLLASGHGTTHIAAPAPGGTHRFAFTSVGAPPTKGSELRVAQRKNLTDGGPVLRSCLRGQSRSARPLPLPLLLFRHSRGASEAGRRSVGLRWSRRRVQLAPRRPRHGLRAVVVVVAIPVAANAFRTNPRCRAVLSPLFSTAQVIVQRVLVLSAFGVWRSWTG